jgi:membrane protein implicated in regulation of membrane protease activity
LSVVEEAEDMDLWVVWLFLAVLLGVAEVFTLTAVLGTLGVAAGVTAGAAAIGLPLPLQLLLFAAVSAGGLVVLRPIARRQARRPRIDRFGVDALVGRTALVLKDVDGRSGTVRIGGEEWTARSLDETQVIPAGATVNVLQIDGATAVVHPRE